MKVDGQTLTENRDAWAMPPVEVEAPPSDDWSASDDVTDAAIEDPAYDRDNWSAADRQRVDALEEAAGHAASAVFDAPEQAVANRPEERRVGKEWVRTGKSRWLPT